MMDEKMRERLADATFQDIVDSPEKYGFVSFEDFAKNPEKWLGSDEDIFCQVDQGSKNLNRIVQRHLYEVEGYRFKSLEQVQQAAKNMGLKLTDYKPMCQPMSAGKCDILVRFVSNETIEKRQNWG